MSEHNVKRQLERRALRAMLAHGILRWESAVIIAGTILLTYFYNRPFEWWPRWGWLALGLAAEIAIVYTSFADVQTGTRVVADMLRQQFNPRTLRSKNYRQQMEKALEYREHIEDVIRRRHAGVLLDRLESTTREVDDWIGNIYRLASRLDAYEADEVIQRDMQTVPRELEKLAQRLRQEDTPSVQQELRGAIAGKKSQWETLEKLKDTMERAEVQLETTLTALGTVYSQLMLIGAKDIEGRRAENIAESIHDEVMALQGILEAMEEVYGSSSGRRLGA
jgi:hypothetical protein